MTNEHRVPEPGTNVRPLIEVGPVFEAKRPEWMSDETWRACFDKLGDLWFDVQQRAAQGLPIS